MPDDDPRLLSDLVMQVARLQRHRWRRLLEPWDLTPSQDRALRVISDGDGVRVSELAERLRIAPRSATEVADDLQARGLVAREPDPRDRRAVLLRPTPQARAMRAEVDRARGTDAGALFGRLSAADRATLARLLRTLAEQEEPDAR